MGFNPFLLSVVVQQQIIATEQIKRQREKKEKKEKGKQFMNKRVKMQAEGDTA